MCKMYTETSDVVYTMYTRYTTFRNSLSKNLISINNLSKKAITHYEVNSIYKYVVERKVYMYPLEFFKKVISKVSTLLTRCVHSISLTWSDLLYIFKYPSDYPDFSSVQRVTCVHKWICTDYDLYIIWEFTISTYKGNIRRYQSMFEFGDDYVV